MSGSGGDAASRNGLVALAGVVVATLALFAPALGNDLLLWDDACYTWQNSHIASLDLGTLAWAFGDYGCNFWAPLTWLSLALDRALWGGSPVGYHLTNVVLHAVNAGLLLLVSRELIQRHLGAGHPGEGGAVRRDRFVLGSSILSALVFSLHPLRVESVAWVAERKDVLSLAFGLPAILAWLRYARSDPTPQPGARGLVRGIGTSPSYWLSFALFCMSLMAKPMLVTLPLILLLLDWHPLGRLRIARWAGLLAEKAPFFLASVAVTLIAVDAQAPQRMPLSQSGVGSRLLNAVRSIAEYLWLTVWPARTSPFYLHPGNIREVGPEYVLSAAVLILVTVVCGVLWRRRPFLLVTWLAWLAALVPILGFAQVGPQAMAARFTYFPSLPISLLAAAGLGAALFGRPWRWPTGLLAASTVGWLVAISVMTVGHISFWKDDVTLWTRVIDLSPRPPGRAYFQRGLGWVRRGDPRRALDDVSQALAIATAKRYPALHEIYVERAAIFSQLGQPRDAVGDYTRALETAGAASRAAILMSRGAAWREAGEDALAAADFAAATERR